jgi:hypothetical protein
MKYKNFTGVLYKQTDKVVIIIEGKGFRFQEHFDGFSIDIKNSLFAKLFGYKRFMKIFHSLFEFQGTIRNFEMIDEHLYVEGLTLYCDNTIHKTGYYEEIWTKKKGK